MKPSSQIRPMTLGEYKFDIDRIPMLAHVSDDETVIESHIVDRLIPVLHKQHPMHLVGMDVKLSPVASYYGYRMDTNKEILVLCVGTYFLIIQQKSVEELSNLYPLQKLFRDEGTCFVGVGITEKLKSAQKRTYSDGGFGFCKNDLHCKTGMDVGDLAARVLNKRLNRLVDIAHEIGVRCEPREESNQETDRGTIDWRARIFSEDEVKSAVYDAYVGYKIAHKLLSCVDI